MPDIRHTLITGHSGSGKSTLAKQLSTQLGQPLVQLDFADPRFKEFLKKDTELKNLDHTTKEHEEFRTLMREMVQNVLAKQQQSSVIEGGQLMTAPDLLGEHRKIVVDTPPRQVVRQRLHRDRTKGKYLPPGSPEARQRAAVAKKIMGAWQPYYDAFKQLPDVEYMRPKMAAEGIPDRGNYGDISKLPIGQLLDYYVQRHKAERAGDHQDLRIGNPELGLYSWAVRKGIPGAADPNVRGGPKKHLAVQQPIHEHAYGGFSGSIASGYGKGTVEKVDEGKVLLTKVEPGKIHFTLAHRRYPERFVLVKPEKFGAKDWLLMNTTPTKPIPYEKVHYKTVPAEKVEGLLQNLTPGSSVQAKIDGAASLTTLLKDKIEVLSYRKSKVHGGPILHTERVFHGIPNTEVPKQYQGSVLRGELYGLQNGEQAVPPQVLGGLLNSSIAKSLPAQISNKIKLHNMVFDVQQEGKHPVGTDVPYAQRIEKVRQILSSIKGPDQNMVQSTLHAPEEAKTPEDALQLYGDIKGGKHPRTTEGIVIHPPTGKPMKSKLFDENDVYIRGFFPGKGKYTDRGMGGFLYSHEPEGQIVGEVGTGLTDAMREEFFKTPDTYLGRRARVSHTGKLRSGALFQPSLIALHEDYPLAKGG